MYLVPKTHKSRDFGVAVEYASAAYENGLRTAFLQGAHAASNGMANLASCEAVKEAAKKHLWLGSEKLAEIIRQAGSLKAFEATRTAEFLTRLKGLPANVSSSGLYAQHHREMEEHFFGIDGRLVCFVRGFEQAKGVRASL